MKILKIILPVLILYGVLQAQTPVIQNIQNKFSKINTLNADFSQSSRINGSHNNFSTKGKIYYQKDDKYRIELRNQEIISDGTTFWNFNKKTNKVVINDLKNEKSAFSFKNLIQDYPSRSNVESAGRETFDGENLDVTKLTPKKKGENYSLIKIWSDQNSLVRRVEITDKAGLVNSFEFSNIRLNSAIPLSKFSFEPPKGSEVVDLR
ncbi:MAG: outer membrane lipoprotein chaperone LolA [Bacillota bacterium]